MGKSGILGFCFGLVAAVIFFIVADFAFADPGGISQHKMRRITQEERESAAARIKEEYPAMAARIAKLREDVTLARKARIMEIESKSKEIRRGK